MDQDHGLSSDLKSRFSALNPWALRFTTGANQALMAIQDPADRAALEVLKKQLEGFPPPERQFQMRMDLSRGALEVWALGGPHLRLRITAVYRLLREECAITHIEVLRPKEANHEKRRQAKKIQSRADARNPQSRGKR